MGTIFDGVNTYTFDVKQVNNPINELFDVKAMNIDNLKHQIYANYKGRKLSAFDLFEEHQVTGNYCRKHYTDALRLLVDDGKLTSEFTDKKQHHVSVLISKECILTFL